MSEIYVMKMAERLDDSLFFLLQNFISLEKKLRIQNLCNTPHRTGILVGDLLIQYILCNHLKLERDEIFFGKKRYGKPFVKNKNSVHFNLSHSGKYIFLGLDHHPIGVDIEKIEERNYLGIAKLYFHIDEYNYLMNLANPKEQKIAFFRLWVMKESYLKAGGYGFHYPVNTLNVLKEKECHIKNGLGFNDYQFFVKEFIDSYVAGVYSHKKEKVQLTEIQFNEVVQFFI